MSEKTIYKGERFNKESVLDIRTHFKPTETFYTFDSTRSTLRVTHWESRKASLQANRYVSSRLILQNKNLFKTHLAERGRERQREAERSNPKNVF